MRFDQPFEWLDQMAELQTERDANGMLKQELTYVPVFSLVFKDVEYVEARVALSFSTSKERWPTSTRKRPTAGSFDTARARAEQQWNAALSRIQIEEPDADERTIFYTSLYHSLTVPNLATDVDGRYRGTDLQVHQTDDSTLRYTVFSCGTPSGPPTPCSTYWNPNGPRTSFGISSACTRKVDNCPCGNWRATTPGA